jgi:hypothetical protein
MLYGRTLKEDGPKPEGLLRVARRDPKPYRRTVTVRPDNYMISLDISDHSDVLLNWIVP